MPVVTLTTHGRQGGRYRYKVAFDRRQKYWRYMARCYVWVDRRYGGPLSLVSCWRSVHRREDLINKALRKLRRQ